MKLPSMDPKRRRWTGYACLALLCLACGDAENARLREELAATQQAFTKAKDRLQIQDERSRELAKVLAQRDARLDNVPGTLDVQVTFKLDDQPIELDQVYSFGEASVSFGSLRYWLSNVSLVNERGDRVDIPNTYYLMELNKVLEDTHAEEPTYLIKKRDTFTLREVPAGKYKQISFDIGVDPKHNDDMSLPGGELNVLNNMARAEWMWFTSYIFTSLWAKYTPAGESEDKAISVNWDCGGNEDLRRVAVVPETPVVVGVDERPKLTLGLNTAQLFEGLVDKIKADGKASPDFPVSYIGEPDILQRDMLSTNWQVSFENRVP